MADGPNGELSYVRYSEAACIYVQCVYLDSPYVFL